MSNSNTVEINIPNYGSVLGTVDHSRQIAEFRNIPFGVVPDRWRAAVKPEPWTGVRDATKQGPISPQVPSTFLLSQLTPKNFPPYGTTQHKYGLTHDDKECLNLNIYVPLSSLNNGAESIPVMTWVHGGSNRSGSNAEPSYNASNFVKRSIELNRPVVVVTINYRLGVFGFIASKELQQDMSEYASSHPTLSKRDQSIGNWGIMDQKLAFEWVRENISAFGGNNRNVTAFGESAGAAGIHYQMLLPSHHGLFDHAILQSGTVSTMPTKHITDGQAFFDALLKILDIPMDIDGKEKVRRLRAIPADELVVAASKVPNANYVPYYDNGDIFPSKIPIQAIARDPTAYDPNLKSLMIGGNKDEGTAFAMLFGNLTLQTWPFVHKALVPHPALAPHFESAYGVPASDEDVVRAVSNHIGDSVFHHGNHHVLSTLQSLKKTRSDLKLVSYHFDVELEAVKKIAPGYGAIHAGELPFLFLAPYSSDDLNEAELALGKEIQKIWIEFANQQELLIDAPGGGKRPIVVEDGEAIIFEADHKIVIGESLRLSKEAQQYLNHRSEATENLILAGFV